MYDFAALIIFIFAIALAITFWQAILLFIVVYAALVGLVVLLHRGGGKK